MLDISRRLSSIQSCLLSYAEADVVDAYVGANDAPTEQSEFLDDYVIKQWLTLLLCSTKITKNH